MWLGSSLSALAQGEWKMRLQQSLPLLGHRNWIVIADSAYPLQTAPGIETIYTGDDQLHVVQGVLEALRKAPHVRPIVFTDAELPFVPEKSAPGIAAYRKALTPLVGESAQVLPHEKIIAKLDEAGRTFHVLLLKTKLTLPYTSVFIQLDCAYWSAEAEAELRAALQAGK